MNTRALFIYFTSLSWIYRINADNTIAPHCNINDVDTENVNEKFIAEDGLSNSFWNLISGKWYFPFDLLKSENLIDICECIGNHVKPGSMNSEITVAYGLQYGRKTTFWKYFIGSSTIECISSGFEFYLVQGRKNYFAKQRYDLYVLQIKDQFKADVKKVNEIEEEKGTLTLRIPKVDLSYFFK